MLLPEELKQYGFQRKLKRIEQIWLDYLQDQILMLLYREYPNLIFRGGTCIWKIYNGERFSEDLDLAHEELPGGIADYLIQELELLGFSVTVEKERETENMYRLRLGIDRPNTGSVTHLSVEILKSRTDERKVEEKEIYSPYPDIPKIDVKALTEDALLAEKISAVCERNRPRDMHNIYGLLKNGATVNLEELREEYEDFTIEEFEKCLEEKEREWSGLKALMVSDLPDFESEEQYIIRRVRKMLRVENKEEDNSRTGV